MVKMKAMCDTRIRLLTNDIRKEQSVDWDSLLTSVRHSDDDMDEFGVN